MVVAEKADAMRITWKHYLALLNPECGTVATCILLYKYCMELHVWTQHLL